MKQAKKGMKKAAKAVCDGVEDLGLSGEVDRITEKIETRIEQFHYSSVASLVELTARFEKWRTGSLRRFDDSHDLSDPRVMKYRQNLTVNLDELCQQFYDAYNLFVDTVLAESTAHLRDQKIEIVAQLPLPQHMLKSLTDGLATSTWKIFHPSEDEATAKKEEAEDTESSETTGAPNELVIKLESMISDTMFDIHEENKKAVMAGAARYCESFGYSAEIKLSRLSV